MQPRRRECLHPPRSRRSAALEKMERQRVVMRCDEYRQKRHTRGGSVCVSPREGGARRGGGEGCDVWNDWGLDTPKPHCSLLHGMMWPYEQTIRYVRFRYLWWLDHPWFGGCKPGRKSSSLNGANRLFDHLAPPRQRSALSELLTGGSICMRASKHPATEQVKIRLFDMARSFLAGDWWW